MKNVVYDYDDRRMINMITLNICGTNFFKRREQGIKSPINLRLETKQEALA